MASNSTWTFMQDKLFENAIDEYPEGTPDGFQKIANAVGDKTVEEVKEHYDKLMEDIKLIEEAEDYPSSSTEEEELNNDNGPEPKNGHRLKN